MSIDGKGALVATASVFVSLSLSYSYAWAETNTLCEGECATVSSPSRLLGRVQVLDEQGNLIPAFGAPVRLEGAEVGVVTTEDGDFTLPCFEEGLSATLVVNEGREGVAPGPWTSARVGVLCESGLVRVPDVTLRPLLVGVEEAPFTPGEAYRVRLGADVVVEFPAGTIGSAPEVTGRPLLREWDLPEGVAGYALAFGASVRVQGGEATGPMVLRFSNDLGLPAGYEDLGVGSHGEGGWEYVADARVSEDGSEVAVEVPGPGDYGVFARWAPLTWARTPAADLSARQAEGRETRLGEVRVSERGGGVGTEFRTRCSLGSWGIGTCEAVVLEYHSSAVDPRVLISVGLGMGEEPPEAVDVEVRSGGVARKVRVEAGQEGAGHFAAVVRPTKPSGEPVGTGLVGYEARVKSLRPAVYWGSGTLTRDLQGFEQVFRGEAAVVNLRDSPYGAGWSVAGLKHLWMDEARSRFFVVDGSRAVIPTTMVRRVSGVGVEGQSAQDCVGRRAVDCVVGPSAVGAVEDGFFVVVGPDGAGVHTFYRVDGTGQVREQYGVDLSGYGVEVPAGSARDLVVSREGDLYYLFGCAVFRLRVEDEGVETFLEVLEVYGTGWCADPLDDPVPASETTFQSPSSLALGEDWTLWVGDGARVRAVFVWDPERTVSTVLGGEESVSGPAWCEWTPASGLRFAGPVEGVASGSDGALYVAAGGRLEEARFVDGAWWLRTRAGIETGCASGVDMYEAHGVAVWQDWQVFVLDRFLGQERVTRLSNAFGWWWPVVERHEMYGLQTVRDLTVTLDGNLVVLASGSQGETGLIEVTRPQDAMMGMRLAPNFAGPGEITWDLRRGDMGSGFERFDKDGRLVFSMVPMWQSPRYYEYGDGTDSVPAGALRRVIFGGDVHFPTRYTDFLYDSRGRLEALRDEDGYETRVRIDERGDLVLIESPEGDFRIYLYDQQHRLRSVIGEQGFTEVIDYNEAGMVTLVSGMRGFLRAAPEDAGRLLDRLSPNAGLPWSPLSGLVTPVLEGLSDYLEDLCNAPSDCDDGLPLTLDWCEAGFCRHEMLGAFWVPGLGRVKAIQGPPYSMPVELELCDEAGDWSEACDDGTGATWDLCIEGACVHLECAGTCGCAPERFGLDCLEKALAETGHGPAMDACESQCCSAYFVPDSDWTCPIHCHDWCVESIAKSVLGMVAGCELLPVTAQLCFLKGQWPECFGFTGTCIAAPFECDEDLDCDDLSECTVDSCVCEDPPACVRKRCVHSPLQDGTLCDDGNLCTGDGTCRNGLCVLGEPISCDDSNPCTIDFCVPWWGCQYRDVRCDRPDDCLVGWCDPEVGCRWSPKPAQTPCIAESRPCAEAVCDGAGQCVASGGPDEDCNDHNPCTRDICWWAGYGWQPVCDHLYECQEVPLEGGGIDVGFGHGFWFPEAIVKLEPDGASGLPSLYDRDMDGLYDASEYLLASHFRPYFVFDDEIKGLDDWEPATLYQARPLDENTIRLVYTALWDIDHGYGDCNCSIFDLLEIYSCFGSDSHVGDAEATVINLRRNSKTGAWEPSDVIVGGGKEVRLNFTYWPAMKAALHSSAWPFFRIDGCSSTPKPSGQSGLSDLCPSTGFHVPVYYSSNKNHAFLSPYGDVDPSPYSAWGMCDDVNGRGPRRLARISTCRFKGYPLPYGNNVGEYTPETECTVKPAGQFRQRWCPEHHPPSHFVNLLDECAFNSKGQPMLRRENAWEEDLYFGGGLEEQYLVHGNICGMAFLAPSIQEWWDDLANFLQTSDPTGLGPPPSEYVWWRKCLTSWGSIPLRNKWFLPPKAED